MKFIDSQIAVLQARILLAHAEIVSGAYKNRRTQRGCGANEDGTVNWRDCTDDEKLSDAIGTMKAHIRLLQECSDYIGEKESK